MFHETGAKKNESFMRKIIALQKRRVAKDSILRVIMKKDSIIRVKQKCFARNYSMKKKKV